MSAKNTLAYAAWLNSYSTIHTCSSEYWVSYPRVQTSFCHEMHAENQHILQPSEKVDRPILPEHAHVD